jgi:two-component system phosphate regulon sensor histidine kinase PhoR
MTRRRWLWITFSIVLAVLLGTLATTYNVVVVQDYRKMVEYARQSHLFELSSTPTPPLWKVTFGTAGFVAALLGVIVFMFKVLKEMKVNQLQSEFIAHVSHELKTPIATLELTGGLLRSDESGESAERRRLWLSHDEELGRLKRQVEDLLEAARWQAGPPKRDPQPIHLGDWIRESSGRWREILGPDAELSIDGVPLDFTIPADGQKMELIFSNLMNNARKFAREKPQVRVSTDRQGRQWKISVEDQGRGFPANESRRIFQRFHRAPHGAPYAIPGSGLGLHLCETVARSMGWRIRASSPGIDHGATFTITGKAPEA